jgi:protein-S-isoprenylcysteine O-methyltransferase Ste14
MSPDDSSGYGLWSLVVVNSAVFIIFAFSFARPRTSTDWRSFGAFSAFLVAMFTEMYGFPLTIYLLSGWLQTRYPEVDFLAHDAGHLLEVMFGWRGNPHFGPFHIASDLLMVGGFLLLALTWKALYTAQRERRLATTGVYARIRHPQYLAFVMVLTGFLLQWPTILTLAMYPVLVLIYVRLAYREERDALAEFGGEYREYMEEVPAFFPRLGASRARTLG